MGKIGQGGVVSITATTDAFFSLGICPIGAHNSSGPCSIEKGGSMGRFCDGVRRRDFLRIGTASLFGLHWSLPRVLEAQQSAQSGGRSPRDVSLIFLYLKGGLSTIDSFDLKPNAPAEFRGEF